jgi:YD repeat-containing protein
MLALAVLAAGASAQSGRQEFRDATGRFVGRSESVGATTQYWDGSGHFVGREVRNGSRVETFDRNGRYAGERRGTLSLGDNVRRANTTRASDFEFP